MSALPSIVRVGPFDYSIRQAYRVDDADNHGRCSPSELVITIRESMAPTREKETVLHEILHAAWDSAGLGEIEHPTEEQIVNGLGKQLIQVIRDNPALVEYMRHDP